MFLYLVGQHKVDGSPWELQGIFHAQKRAALACPTEYYFVIRVEADVEFPAESSHICDTWVPVNEPMPDGWLEPKDDPVMAPPPPPTPPPNREEHTGRL